MDIYTFKIKFEKFVMSYVSKLSDLDKVRGDEKLVHGLSELLNAMAEASRLAGKYGLANELYYGGGLGKVTDFNELCSE